MNRKKRKTLLKIAILFLLVLGAFLLRNYLERRPASYGTRKIEFAKNVSDSNVLKKEFKKTFPDRNVVLACESDVTNDGLDDLVVIYKEGKDTRTVVMTDNGDGTFSYSEPIPGPIEHQGIQFKNIDEKDEMEFIISGSKNGNTGYAIYRMIDGQPKDLFGEGMEDCC